MGHDVFISFSSVNTDIAKKVCAALEESGEVKCWIAFRDIVPSANYAEQLVKAIESSKMLLLILSEDSNKSPQVAREIERAGSKGIPILPLLIENVQLSKSMEYFISSHHWLSAYDGEIETYFPSLKEAVNSAILDNTGERTADYQAVSAKTAVQRVKKRKQKIIAGAGAALLLLLALVFLFRPEQNTPSVPSAAPPSADYQPTAVTAGPASPRDALIMELAGRFRENRPPEKQNFDGWTSSSPMSIAFLDIAGNNLDEAELDFLLNNIMDDLRNSGRYSPVEREIIDKLLEELNLSSSELADPATALRLGRILSAGLIVTGSISKREDGWLANFRFIETETTAVRCSVAEIFDPVKADVVASGIIEAMERKLRQTFPLQGKITAVFEESANMNIGSSSGVRPGMVFDLLGDDNAVVDEATVTAVEQRQSRVDFSGGISGHTEEMRLRERI